MTRSAVRTMFTLMGTALAGWTLTACVDDSSGPDTETVSVQGIVTETDSGDPVEGLYVHLLYGVTVAPVALDVDDTDANGAYLVSGAVPTDNCHQVQLWVLAEEEFDAFAERIAAEPLGGCVAGIMDFTVTAPEGGGG